MIKATKQATTNYEPAPEGTHVARCVALVDLGTQINSFTEKEQYKIRLSFETPNETKVFREENGEQPFMLSKEYTLSLHEKSSLRPVVQALMERKVTEQEERDGFDLSQLLGKPCMITVEHYQSGDKIYANISAVAPLMKGIDCPAQITESLIFDISSWDEEKFNNMPEWLREKILKSPEAQEASTNSIVGEQISEDDISLINALKK